MEKVNSIFLEGGEHLYCGFFLWKLERSAKAEIQFALLPKWIIII